ncbi:MAG: RNA polymerase sigma factor [Pseudomonadota bacterium]
MNRHDKSGGALSQLAIGKKCAVSVKLTFAGQPIDQTPLVRAFLDCQEELVSFFRGRLKSPESARDLSHEVYLRLQRVEDPGAINNHRSYIFKIARNLLIDHVRTETRRSTLLAEAGSVPWETRENPSPEQVVLARDDLETLRRAVSSLQPLSRRIFYAHRFERKTRQQIADEYCVSLTTVENHIRRVLDHFADALENQDPDSQ